MLTSSRGVIYDRNMNILASNATVETIFLDPNALARRIEEEAEKREAGKEYNPAVSVDFIAKGLADLLDVETDFVKEQAADTAYYYKVIKRKVPEETAQEVRDFIAENDLSGIINLELDSRRYYPYGSLAAQVLGFVNLEDVGARAWRPITKPPSPATPARSSPPRATAARRCSILMKSITTPLTAIPWC